MYNYSKYFLKLISGIILFSVLGVSAIACSGELYEYPHRHDEDIQLEDKEEYSIVNYSPYHLYRDMSGLNRYSVSSSSIESSNFQDFVNDYNSIRDKYISDGQVVSYSSCPNVLEKAVQVYGDRAKVYTDEQLRNWFLSEEDNLKIACLNYYKKDVSYGIFEKAYAAEGGAQSKSVGFFESFWNRFINIISKIFNFGNSVNTTHLPITGSGERYLSTGLDRDELFKFDSEYQEAVSNFYKKDDKSFNTAIEQFENIKNNKSQIWRSAAAYNIGRLYIRKAYAFTDDNDYNLTVLDKENYLKNMQKARDEFENISKDKDFADIHDDAVGLYNYCLYKIDPQSSLSRSEDILRKKDITEKEVLQNLPDIYLASNEVTHKVGSLESWLDIMMYGPQFIINSGSDNSEAVVSSEFSMSSTTYKVFSDYKNGKSLVTALPMVQSSLSYYAGDNDYIVLGTLLSEQGKHELVKILNSTKHDQPYYKYVTYYKIKFIINNKNLFSKDEIETYKKELDNLISTASDENLVIDNNPTTEKDALRRLRYQISDSTKEAFGKGKVEKEDLIYYDIDTLQDMLNTISDNDMKGVMRAEILRRAFVLNRFDLVNSVSAQMYGSSKDFDKSLDVISCSNSSKCKTQYTDNYKAAEFAKLVSSNSGFQNCQIPTEEGDLKADNGLETYTLLKERMRNYPLFISSDMKNKTEKEFTITNISARDWVGNVILNKLPTNYPDTAELMSLYINNINHYSNCGSPEKDAYPKEIYQILQSKYSDTKFAEDTPYYY